MCFVDLSAWGIYKGLEDYTHSWRVFGCYYTYLISSQNCLVMLLHMHALCLAWKTTMITGNSLILNMDVSQLESCHAQTGLSELKKKNTIIQHSGKSADNMKFSLHLMFSYKFSKINWLKNTCWEYNIINCNCYCVT